MIQRPVQLVHCVRAEGIAHFRAVESDAHCRKIADYRAVVVAFNPPVIGDVSELETFHEPPLLRIEDVRDLRREGRVCVIAGVRASHKR